MYTYMYVYYDDFLLLLTNKEKSLNPSFFGLAVFAYTMGGYTSTTPLPMQGRDSLARFRPYHSTESHSRVQSKLVSLITW